MNNIVKPKKVNDIFHNVEGSGNSCCNGCEEEGYNEAIVKREEWLRDKVDIEKLGDIIVDYAKGRNINILGNEVWDIAIALNKYLLED